MPQPNLYMNIKIWKVIRITAVAFFLAGGIMMGLTSEEIDLGFGTLSDFYISLILLFPIIPCAIFIKVCAYRDLKKFGHIDKPEWDSNFFNNSSLHFFHLCGYCFIATATGNAISNLISNNSQYLFSIFSASIGTGLLLGILWSKNIFRNENIKA